MRERSSSTQGALESPTARIRPDGARRASSAVRARLDGGTRVVVWREPRSEVVAVRFLWPGGLLVESAQAGGTSQLLVRVLVQSCGRQLPFSRPGYAISGVTGRDSLGLHVEWPLAEWPGGLEDLVRCVVVRPFSVADVRAERRALHRRLDEAHDDPGFAGFRLLSELLYRRHPYRMDALGDRDAITEITRDALVDHSHRHYPASELVVAVVGDVDPRQVIETLRRAVGDAPVNRPPSGQPGGLPERPREEWDGRTARSREAYRYIDGEWGHLLVGFPGLEFDDPDRHVLDVLAAVLEARLRNAPSDLAMTRVMAHSVAAVDPGFVVVSVTCPAGELGRVHAAVRAAVLALAARGATADEIARAKRALIARHYQVRERPQAMAAALAFHEVHGSGPRSFLGHPREIAQVTPGDVARVARAYLDWSRVHLATVTPRIATPAASRRIRGVRRRAPRQRRVRGDAGRP